MSDQPIDTRFGGLSVGWGGEVTAVGQSQDALFASIRDKAGAWSELAPISGSLTLQDGSEASDLAGGSPGFASSVFGYLSSDDTAHIAESHRVKSGWSEPTVVGIGDVAAVAVDASDTTTVARGGPDGLSVHTRSMDGEWGKPTLLAQRRPLFLDIAVNASGDTVVIWCRRNGALRGSYRPRGGDWGLPVSVPRSSSACDPSVGIDRAGRVLVVWALRSNVGWTRRSLGGVWSPMRKVKGDPGWMGEYGSARLSVNRRGDALAVWWTDRKGVEAARYRRGRGFGRVIHLSPNRVAFRGFSFALETPERSEAVVTWGGEVRLKESGVPWGPVESIAGDVMGNADSRGRRLAFLYYNNNGTFARVLDFAP